MTTSFIETYSKLNTLSECVPDLELQSVLPAIWQLDDKMRAEINPVIEQYQNGCLHSMEFVQHLIKT